MMVIGKRIKELRKLYNFSQEELGNKLGIQRSAINKYEKGTVENIPLKTVERLAHVFEVTPNYLFGWKEKTTDPLTLEEKILQGVQKFYGKNALEILELFTMLSSVGKKRLQDYADELIKIYSSHNNQD